MEFTLGRLRVSSCYLPMEKIGGDYFDFHIHPEGSISFILCDVMGHGISAALVAGMLKVNFLELSPKILDPAMFLEELNRKMISVMEKKYITAVFCHFNREQTLLQYSIMGHPSPFYLDKANGDIKALVGKGPILGWKENVHLKTEVLEIKPNQRFFFYTDGVSEAHSQEKVLYGEARLIQFLQKGVSLPPDQFNKSLKENIQMYSERIADDVTFFTVDIQ